MTIFAFLSFMTLRSRQLFYQLKHPVAAVLIQDLAVLKFDRLQGFMEQGMVGKRIFNFITGVAHCRLDRRSMHADQKARG